ncbi:MAG: hypothetical protein ISP90_14020 [Nevskia sp.]|nr:hypothetical protein [Nevskia sp.]
MRRLVQAAFWAALLLAFTCAILPADSAPQLVPWDKAEHFIAFYVLAVLGAVAYPASALVLLGASLSAFGALIEVVQAIPALHRDSDFWDWVADTLAIAAALLPVVLIRVRKWMAAA